MNKIRKLDSPNSQPFEMEWICLEESGNYIFSPFDDLDWIKDVNRDNNE
jgi:hypothetical protein